jgi:hypothetical protein
MMNCLFFGIPFVYLYSSCSTLIMLVNNCMMSFDLFFNSCI